MLARRERAFPMTPPGMGDKVHLATPQVGIETTTQDVVNALPTRASRT